MKQRYRTRGASHRTRHASVSARVQTKQGETTLRFSSHEQERLHEAHEHGVPWQKWGPYLSERQWGTVREDYSANGDAWSYFTHDQARSRAYRSGEDGIAGFCDEAMRLCFALAVWNGVDPFLKERLFGVTPAEGNHGQDVKEYYFYLDATPTTSYAKMLYKYPQAAFPYQQLVQVNRARSSADPEFELADTGIFDSQRYYDIQVEYAKASPEDILIRITATNRGPDASLLYVLPHLWFRNVWWRRSEAPIPVLTAGHSASSQEAILTAEHHELGKRYLHCGPASALLFTNNETNIERLFGTPNPTPYVKDGINNFLVQGRRDVVNPEQAGTKAAALYRLPLGPGATQSLNLRLNQELAPAEPPLGQQFDQVVSERRREADEFYASIIPASANAEKAQFIRQGFAGLLWSKQVYIYEVASWLKDHCPTPDEPTSVRNSGWFHLDSHDIISTPDKWEYPQFSAWDLAFQTIPFAFLDPEFAQQQFNLMLCETMLHPNGQLPASERDFSEVTPPMQAWAVLLNYRLTQKLTNGHAIEILKTSFHKLLLNFAWWVNRRDSRGRNVFEGGFLDVSNIGVFDTDTPLPRGAHLEHADGTAWMVFYAQNMLAISLELALHDRVYEDLAIQFYDYFILTASAMGRLGDGADSMWDETDGFFYNVLRLPDGTTRRIKVRSVVGLLPLCAVLVYPAEVVQQLPRFMARMHWFEQHRPNLVACISPPRAQGVNGRYMLATLDETRLRRVLERMLDPNEFLSDYGIRSLSRAHLANPSVIDIGGKEYRIRYSPGEATSELPGTNGNWRGPIWMPENALVLRALVHMYTYYGKAFKIECPTGSGRWLDLFEVATDLANRIVRLFLRDKNGQRPIYGNNERFQKDAHWRDLVLFNEYFNGDSGVGLGASHQTGWTALAPAFACLFGGLHADLVLKEGLASVVSVFTRASPERQLHASRSAKTTDAHNPKANPTKVNRTRSTKAAKKSPSGTKKLF